MSTKTSVRDIKEKTTKFCKTSAHKTISKYYRSEKVFWITRYQIGLKESIKGSNIVCDNIDGVYYKCHFRILNHVRSYIDSPD